MNNGAFVTIWLLMAACFAILHHYLKVGGVLIVLAMIMFIIAMYVDEIIAWIERRK